MLLLRNTTSALQRFRLFSHSSVYTCYTICNMSPGVESPAKRQKMEVDGVDDAVMDQIQMENVEQEEHKQIQTEKQSPPEPVLKFARLSPDAYAPVRGSDHAAGFDLKSSKDMIVKAKDKALVPTDLQMALPEGCYGRIAPRSGLATKKFIDVGAGVIDRDYRGNVHVLLFNFSDNDFEVTKGERIAQLICERIFMPKLELCETLDDTKRGEGGFGSTGAK